MRQFDQQKSRRSHPVVVAAVVAVLTFSLLGIGAVTGLIPSAYSDGSKVWRKSELADGQSFNSARTLPLPGVLARAACPSCGVVDSIRSVQIEGGTSEKNVNRRTVYRVTVRMDDGSFRTVSQPHSPTLAVGSRVRLAKGSLVEQS